MLPLRLEPAPERRRPPEPALTSYSPVLTAAFEDTHNVLLPSFVDTRDDGEVGYDEVQLVVLRKGLGTRARRRLGEYRFPPDRFSPWIRVRLSEGPAGREGWLKIRFDPPSADVTGHVIEALGLLGVSRDDPCVRRGLQFLREVGETVAAALGNFGKLSSVSGLHRVYNGTNRI